MSRDGRPVSRIADDFERAADLLDPLTHSEDSEVALSRKACRSRVETASVVLNFQTDGG
jgi:hypothetical protein